MQARSRQILIFAKAPVPGFCKTRLGRRIGYRRAARVYQQLLTRVVKTSCSLPGIDQVALYCAPDCRHPFLAGLAREYGLTLRRQVSGHLGRRMYEGLRAALTSTEQAVLIGADCPALTRAHIQAAFTALDQGRDMVFGPALDGGYIMVGAQATEYRGFHDVEWGTGRVMQQTRRRLVRLGLSWSELPSLPDLDEFADYRRARREGLLPFIT